MKKVFFGFIVLVFLQAFIFCNSSDQPLQIPQFELTQPELFGAAGSLTNAWADYDNDGDLDFFVGFRQGIPDRFYRNDNGRFTNIAEEIGLADTSETRAAAWGDYNNDGYLDLYVGFTRPAGSRNHLYRNNGDGSFTDTAPSLGVDIAVNIRQVCWIDYDNDGDVDLFIAVRDNENRLFRNDADSFTDVSRSMGINDARRTVGAAWFDYDQDGDLDLYVTNQNGDANGLFRNDITRFVDVASESGVESGGRPLDDPDYGSIRPNIADFDNDGDFDILVVNYGPNALYRNEGNGTFVNVGERAGLAIDNRYDSGAWGDFNHDGTIDLYINGTISRGTSYRDYLFRNEGNVFTDVTPTILLDLHADHGVSWVDFDNDGDLDLSLTGADIEKGMHHLVRNLMPAEDAIRSLKVQVLDANGHNTRAGTEVRFYSAATKELLGSRLFDTGSGYNTQNAIPVHFGLAENSPVDVEITSMTAQGRKTAVVPNVNPGDYKGRVLIIRVDENGVIVK